MHTGCPAFRAARGCSESPDRDGSSIPEFEFFFRTDAREGAAADTSLRPSPHRMRRGRLFQVCCWSSSSQRRDLPNPTGHGIRLRDALHTWSRTEERLVSFAARLNQIDRETSWESEAMVTQLGFLSTPHLFRITTHTTHTTCGQEMVPDAVVLTQAAVNLSQDTRQTAW